MSARTALISLRGLLQDEQLGFAHAIEQLGATTEQPAGAIVTALRFVSWVLPEAMQPATTANVLVRPRTWLTDIRMGNHRDGRCQFDVGYQMFSADPVVIEANIALAASALAQTIDGIRAYSDTTAGPIIDLDDSQPLLFTFGQFDGKPKATTNGFLCTITLTERSRE